MREMIGRLGRGPSWLRATAVALAVTGAFVACDDDDPTGPNGDEGDVEAFVTDDPTSASPSVADRLGLSAAAAAAITGDVSGDARVDISVDGSEWIQLGSMSDIDLALQSTDEVSVNGEASVPAGSYTRVRLVLDGAAADLAAGSDIGGIVLDVDATVTIGDGGEVIIERALQFTVSASVDTRIVFDLNAEQWLTQNAVTTGQATEASVDASVTAAAFFESE